MIPVSLTRIKTRDGVTLYGIVVPPKRKGDTALIYIHGLGSSFYSGYTLTTELSRHLARHGIAYLKFNTRGHHAAVWGRKRGEILGAGFERFEDCISDIKTMIRFARSLGYKNIILAGHSTGANKVLYHAHKTKSRGVKGIMLLGPISDIPAKIIDIGKRRLERGLRTAAKLSKKNASLLMPREYGILTARRFLSLYHQGSTEDVFPYHNSAASWKELKSVRVPIAVIIGDRDKHLDRPAADFINSFRANTRSTKSFSGVIIKGADHGFRKKEKELSHKIIQVIKKWSDL